MKLFDLARERALIHSTAATLGWDQETHLPDAAHPYRAAQLSWLTAKAHLLSTSDEWKAALEEGEAADKGGDVTLTANLREMRRQFDRSTKLPVELVARESEATSLGKHAWASARENSDFAAFAPHLETLLAIAREKAELWGYESEPYDALLDTYERGSTAAKISALFDTLRPQLINIGNLAVANSEARNARLPAGPYPIEAQKRFNAVVAKSLSFEFNAGRIDTTTHPFCTTLGPRDIRLTTRYDTEDFTSSLFGVMHEAGHGLYEQGLPQDDFGLPSGDAVSLGIHESQSRLWENHVGRSQAFWERWFPFAVECFPQLGSLTIDDFLAAIRRAEKSYIRVEADEATYDLHILLRFDLERRMMNGELAVKDIPAAWNESFEKSFGITPPDDRHGCLQDIHWSMGGLGYFSTYTLGNINAAQLFATASADPTVAAGLAKAEYKPLLAWLRTNIHAHGGTYDPAVLIEKATGAPPSPDAHLSHLFARYCASAI
ncbi:carboxypeptidase M32 [Luteolibacter ambystomatis]|uniref:carboxypeptidase M32 n=1 Tax=Luteolibacter ambystomatis TaxID=2824561 RepID=UPI001CF7A04E|nr:carboxypeptidase M32 [Luteolibacter ambystomatis]